MLLRSGFTKLTEVVEAMGYRTHSAVSKRLDHILRQAARFGPDRAPMISRTHMVAVA